MQPRASTRSAPRILVVDDDHSVRTAIRVLLHHEGYEVTEAYNGTEAIDRARAAPHDLILCDIFMPRKDGFDTIREMRREFPHIPIVGMSSGGSVGGSNALRMALHVDAASVLHKP